MIPNTMKSDSLFFSTGVPSFEKKPPVPTLVNLCVQTIKQCYEDCNAELLNYSLFPSATFGCKELRRFLFKDKDVDIVSSFDPYPKTFRDIIISMVKTEAEELVSLTSEWNQPFLSLLIQKFTKWKKQDDLLTILKLVETQSQNIKTDSIATKALETEASLIRKKPTKSLFSQLLEQRCNKGKGVLHNLASWADSEEIIKIVLKHADPQELLREDKSGKTPIDMAEEHNKPEVVARLKSYLSDSQLETLKASSAKAGLTPLHYAAMHGTKDEISELIKKQPESIHAQDSNKRTPLEIAIEYKKHDNVNELLLHYSPERLLDFFQKQNQDIVFLSSMNTLGILWRKCPSLFTKKWLAPYPDQNCAKNGGFTLLGHMLSECHYPGATHIVMLLPKEKLKEAIILDSLMIFKSQFLSGPHPAPASEYYKALLNKCPEILFPNWAPDMPGFWFKILDMGSEKLARELIQHMPQDVLEMIDSYKGDNIFHYFASTPYTDLLKDLSNRVNKELLYMKNKEGQTPLTCATISGQLRMAKCIIKKLSETQLYDASTNAVNGKTIFHWVISALRDDKVKIDEAKKFITYLLTKFPKEWLSKKDEKGNTAYDLAKSMGIQDEPLFLNPTGDI